MRKNSSLEADYSHDFATFLNLSAYSLLFAQKKRWSIQPHLFITMVASSRPHWLKFLRLY